MVAALPLEYLERLMLQNEIFAIGDGVIAQVDCIPVRLPCGNRDFFDRSSAAVGRRNWNTQPSEILADAPLRGKALLEKLALQQAQNGGQGFLPGVGHGAADDGVFVVAAGEIFRGAEFLGFAVDCRQFGREGKHAKHGCKGGGGQQNGKSSHDRDFPNQYGENGDHSAQGRHRHAEASGAFA